MGRRRRPPGAKGRGPTPRRGFDPFSSDPAAVMHRIRNLEPIVACLVEYEAEVMWEIREELERGEWSPPLPENYSIMSLTDDLLAPQGQAIVGAYGLSTFVRQVVATELERHELAQRWNVWDAVGYKSSGWRWIQGW